MVNKASTIRTTPPEDGKPGIWIFSDPREQATLRAAMAVYRYWRNAGGRGMLNNWALSANVKAQASDGGKLQPLVAPEIDNLIQQMEDCS